MSQVGQWVDGLNLSVGNQAFAENHVDGEVLAAEGQGEAAAAAAPPTQEGEDMTVAMRRRPGEEGRRGPPHPLRG